MDCDEVLKNLSFVPPNQHLPKSNYFRICRLRILTPPFKKPNVAIPLDLFKFYANENPILYSHGLKKRNQVTLQRHQSPDTKKTSIFSWECVTGVSERGNF